MVPRNTEIRESKEISDCSIEELARGIKDPTNQGITAFKVTRYYLERIQKYNEQLNAFVEVNTANALIHALVIDYIVQSHHQNSPEYLTLGKFQSFFSQEFPLLPTKEIELVSAKALDILNNYIIHDAQGKPAGFRQLGSLAGIPVAIKDTFDVQGMPTHSIPKNIPGAESYVAKEDAEIVKRIRRTDAIIIGKTTAAEGAEDFQAQVDGQPVRNPYRPGHTTGGSSSGGGAAIAADLVPLEINSDAAGSNQTPAAFSGIVGVKLPDQNTIPNGLEGHSPAYHHFPLLMPLRLTIAAPGISAKKLGDVEFALKALRVDIDNITTPEPDAKKVLWLEQVGDIAVTAEIAEKMAATREKMAANGFEITDIDTVTNLFSDQKFRKKILDLFGKIYGAEARKGIKDSGLAAKNKWSGKLWNITGGKIIGAVATRRYIKEKEMLAGQNPVLKAVIEGMKNPEKLEEWYKEREEVREEIVAALKDFAAIVMPATPITAFKHQQSFQDLPVEGSHQPYLDTLIAYSVLANLLNLPSITLPNGITKDGLPTAVKIVGEQLKTTLEVAENVAGILDPIEKPRTYKEAV